MLFVFVYAHRFCGSFNKKSEDILLVVLYNNFFVLSFVLILSLFFCDIIVNCFVI